ncbi:MAG: transposase [Acidobacteriota bacterium]|jgi:transposase-like protein|nr:transposase [Acidobacteriota bacterium]
MTKSNDGKRRFFTPTEKVRILKLNLLENVPVSEVCQRYHLAPTLYYRWQKQFFENGEKAFESEAAKQKPLERKIENLEAKLQTKNEVVSELMEEHLKLKKSLGET